MGWVEVRYRKGEACYVAKYRDIRGRCPRGHACHRGCRDTGMAGRRVQGERGPRQRADTREAGVRDLRPRQVVPEPPARAARPRELRLLPG